MKKYLVSIHHPQTNEQIGMVCLPAESLDEAHAKGAEAILLHKRMGRDDIEGMVAETIAGKLLNGYRGAEIADFERLYETIAQLSLLAMEQTDIQEIEINPLIVYPKGMGVLAIDSRMILK